MTKKPTPTDSAEMILLADSSFLVLGDPESAELIAEASPTPADLDKLRVPSGSGGAAFTIETLEGEEFVKTMDVVVAYESPIERAFFATKVGDGDGGPPHCSSHDGKVGWGVRDVDAILSAKDGEDLEGTELPCEDCAFSKFGSALDGGKGQACKQKIRLIVFDESNLMPTVLQIPSASLKSFKQYKLKLLNGRKRLSRVVTKLGLSKVSGSPDYYMLTFSFVRDLGEAEVGKLAQVAAAMTISANG